VTLAATVKQEEKDKDVALGCSDADLYRSRLIKWVRAALPLARGERPASLLWQSPSQEDNG